MPTTKSKSTKLKIRSSTKTVADKKTKSESVESERGISTLFSWSAPDRIWQPKSRMWYLTSALVVMLVILFAVISQYPSYQILVVAMLLFLVLWFVQGSVPPQISEHRITSKGLFTREVFYHWNEIAAFWIANKSGQLLLHVDFIKELNLPRQTFLISHDDTQEIFDLMVTKVKYASDKEAQYNFLAKMIYGEYFPIAKFIADLDKE